MEELQKGPAVLRLSYLADVEDERLVEQRMNALKKQIADSWRAGCETRNAPDVRGCAYELSIEPEVFWRRGGPVGKSRVETQEGGTP